MFHGLGGDDGSWRHYTKFFLDEKAKGIQGSLSTLNNAFSVPFRPSSAPKTGKYPTLHATQSLLQIPSWGRLQPPSRAPVHS